MSTKAVILSEELSFFNKQIYKFRVNSSLKDCESMSNYLSSCGEVEKSDKKLSIIASEEGNQVLHKYLAIKGYNKDGSIKPLKIYTLKEGKVVNLSSKYNVKTIVVDLYENNMYLHSYSIDNSYIEGYVIRQQRSNKGKHLLFTKEKVKIFIKNINNFIEFTEMHKFLNQYFF